MTNQPEKPNLGGRPKSYSPDLVRGIVLKFIEDGATPADIDAAKVKGQLCELHGVSKQIRPEPLQELVEVTLAEIAEDERRSLLTALPGSVSAAVDDAMAAAGRELLLLVARQNAACKSAADTECEVLRADKRNAIWRAAQLEADLQERARTLADVEQELEAALRREAEIVVQRDAALREIDRLGRETSTVERLLTELRNPAIRDDIRATLAEITASPVPEARPS